MCCFNKVNLSAILLVHKRIINKDCTVKNNNEVRVLLQELGVPEACCIWFCDFYWADLRLCLWNAPSGQGTKDFVEISLFLVSLYIPMILWKPVTSCSSHFSFHASSQEAMINRTCKEMPMLCNISTCPSIGRPSTSPDISYATHRAIT